MKKLLLSIALLSFGSLQAQNYYGTEFIGESGVNSPQGFIKKKDKIVLSSLIGGDLTGSLPITFKGGNADGIITSINTSDGKIEWIKQFGGGGDEVVIDTDIDADGNYYLTGYMTSAGSKAMDADPGPDVYPLPIPSALTNRDIFIIKLDKNGDFIWAKQMSTPSGAGNDDVSSIKLDTKGNIYLAGSFVKVDFDPGTEEELHIASGNADAFIVKLTNDGEFTWVKTFDGEVGKILKITSMDLDTEDNIYVSGRYQGTIDLNPDPIHTNIETSLGSYDTYLAKYTAAGDYVWGLSYGGSGADIPEKVIVNNGNVYVGGSFSETVDLDPSTGTNIFTAAGQQAYLSKFDTNGEYQSSFVIDDSTANQNMIRDIVSDDKGNIYVSGLFQNMTINGTTYSTPHTNADAFFLKLDDKMMFSSIYLVQGPGQQSAPYITQLNDQKFVITGSSKQKADYDYTSNTSAEIPSNAQSYTYITKFDFEKTNLSTDDIVQSNEFTIYPNPVVDIAQIDSKQPIKIISIYTIDGKRVMTQEKSSMNQINMSILPKGLYILQATDKNGKNYQEKLIKK